MADAIEPTRHILLLLVAIACVYTDLARNKIYNGVTLPALALGLILAGLLDAEVPGIPNLKAAVIAALAGGGLLFVIYLVGGLGAGDVKLMAAIGALSPSMTELPGANWQFVLLALFYTALVGAGIAIGVLIWRGQLLKGLKDSARTLFTFRAKPREGRPPLTIPYGLAIGVGTIWAWFETFALAAG